MSIGVIASGRIHSGEQEGVWKGCVYVSKFKVSWSDCRRRDESL